MNALRNRLGFALRETGQALERVGCIFQGINSFEEEITRLSPIAPVGTKVPSVPDTTWVAPSASVVGEVTVGDNSSVWYNATVRGDTSPVSIGNSTNLQDHVHVGSLAPGVGPTTVGSYVSVGHGAVLQGCTVHDRALVGMNAVVQPGAVVKSGSIVAAGAVVPRGATVASGELWAGNPARRLRGLKPEEEKYLDELPDRYRELAAKHASVLAHVRARMDAKASGAGA